MIVMKITEKSRNGLALISGKYDIVLVADFGHGLVRKKQQSSFLIKQNSFV